MALFDHYVMVDWTGGNDRKTGKPDAIWLASGARTATEPAIANPASRTEAVGAVRDILAPFAKSGADTRVLACFDFAYGYPRGFAAHPSGSAAIPKGMEARLDPYLCGSPGRHWDKAGTEPIEQEQSLRCCRQDQRGSISGRWAVWTVLVLGQAREPTIRPAGSAKRAVQDAERTRSWYSLGTYRLTDVRAQSDTPFRLFGAGCVGSQVLTGIPCLERLRFDNSLSGASAVWPFETGWAGDPGWPSDTVRIVHAEIYPSVQAPLVDAIKDRGQVRAMWHWARDLDAKGTLVNELAIPSGIRADSADDVAIREEEGWILGCPSGSSPPS